MLAFGRFLSAQLRFVSPPQADADGYFEYLRPEGKSGGHGIGWSEIPRYGFRVAPGWQEVATSIADLGGTEVCGFRKFSTCSSSHCFPSSSFSG